MLTLELDRQLETRLLEIAREEQQTPAQIINHLLAQYLSSRQSAELLVNVAKDLPVIDSFAGKDPLSIQKEMRVGADSEILVDELRNGKTISPITQSLIGLLAHSNVEELDYKKYLEDKYR